MLNSQFPSKKTSNKCLKILTPLFHRGWCQPGAEVDAWPRVALVQYRLAFALAENRTLYSTNMWNLLWKLPPSLCLSSLCYFKSGFFLWGLFDRLVGVLVKPCSCHFPRYLHIYILFYSCFFLGCLEFSSLSASLFCNHCWTDTCNYCWVTWTQMALKIMLFKLR